MIDGRVLFQVRGISSYPADQRAQTISDRIVALAKNPNYQPGSLSVAEQETLTRIESAGHLILAVSDADAALEDAPRPILVMTVVTRIDEAVKAYREARTASALWRSGFRSLGLTVLFAGGLFAFLWVYRRLESLAERYCRRGVDKDQIRAAGVFQAEKLVEIVRNALRLLRGVILLAAALAYLDLVLTQFPWTTAAATRVFNLVVGPLQTMAMGVVQSLPDLAFLSVLFVVLRWVLRLIRLLFDAVGRGAIVWGAFEPEWAEPTFRIVRLLVIAFGMVVAYPYLPGSGSDAFKGVSLFVGVLFSLGSTGFISNMVAGYSLTYRRAYRVGDRVRIGEVVGQVEHVRLQVTHVRSLKNEEIIIPNSVVVNSNVVNYSSLAKKQGLILHTTVGIGYETPWRQVEAMLIQAASRTPGLLLDPPPFVRQQLLGDFCVTYELNVYSDEPTKQEALYTELHRNILDVFNEYGVQIMTPAYEGDPAEPKVVPKDKWFESPAIANCDGSEKGEH